MLRLVKALLPTRFTLLEMDIAEAKDQAVVTLSSKIDLDELQLFIACTLLAALEDLISKATGRQLPCVFAKLPLANVRDIAIYRSRFKLSDAFADGCLLEVQIPTEVYELPCLTADEYTYRNVLRESEKHIKEMRIGGSLSHRVKTYLHEGETILPSQEELASAFGLSVRTLIRKLRDDNTSYQTLLDEVRKERASWLLGNAKVSIDTLASEMGYSDTSNLSRVFRKWYGCTPTEFRRKLL